MSEKEEDKKKKAIMRCMGSSPFLYIASIILLIFLFISGVSLYNKLKYTQSQLESCRSSCSMKE